MQSVSQWFITDFVPAFGRTLVHSLWQGVAAAILAGLVIAFTRKSSAAMRYNGLVAVYALFIGAVSISFFSELKSSASTTLAQPSPSSESMAIIITENNSVKGEVAEQSFINNILLFVTDHAVLFVGIWALLFALQLIRMAVGLRYVQRVQKEGISSVSMEWVEWMNAMRSRLGITKAVILLQSKKIKVPVALGVLKPVVLVPVGLLTQLTLQQAEAVLLHELAHIRRKDYLVNLVQSVVDAVFFFNPALLWISARIREERETCCDNIVVQHTANRKGYVEALVSFSQLPLSSSYAMAIGTNKNHLLNRVKTIITRENTRLTAREQTTLVLGTLVLMAIGFVAFKPKEKGSKNEVKVEAEIKTGTEVKKERRVLSMENYGLDSKQITPPATEMKPLPKPVADTVPASKNKTGPVSWKNISTNVADDGTGKTVQIIATAQDGTVYRLRKVANELVALQVNGNEIAKENYPQYHSIVDAIEQSVKKGKEDGLKAQEKQTKLLQHQQEALLHKQEALQQQLAHLDKKKQVYQTDSLYKLKLLDTYRKQEKDYNQKEREYRIKESEYYQKEQDYLKKEKDYNQKLQDYKLDKKLLTQQKAGLHSNNTMSAIIADLMANKMVESETRLSFTLTDKELVVDGKQADKSVFELFRKKYIKSTGDSYNYSRNGGSTSSSITIQ